MLQMLSSSHGLVGFRVIGGRLTSPIKELTEELTSRISLAKLGPMLVKYLQNLSAISSASIIVLSSAELNDEGKGALLLRLFIILLSNFQVVLRSFLRALKLSSIIFTFRETN